MMKYGKEIVQKIVEQLQIGMKRDDVCAILGFNRDTFYDWMKKRPDFSDAVLKAELVCKQRNIVRIQNASKKSWTAAAWWLERKFPDEFAQRSRYELTGQNGGPVQVAPDPALPAVTEEMMIAFVKAVDAMQVLEKKNAPALPAPQQPG
jgi:hypothetical protein